MWPRGGRGGSQLASKEALDGRQLALPIEFGGEELQAEISKILKSPDISKKLLDLGLDPSGSTPAELAAYQKSEIAKWSKVVKDSGAKVE